MEHFAISPNIGVIGLDLGTVGNQFNVEHNIHENTISINPHTEVMDVEQEERFSVYQKSNYRYNENGRLISEQRTVLQNNITFDEILDETVIEIFKDEIESWFLGRLREIYPKIEIQYRYHPNEMIALSVCIMYPETIHQYLAGQRAKGTSRDSFSQGFRRLQNNVSSDLLDDFYSSVRCGLFHMASLNNNRYIRYDYSNVSDNAIIIEKNGNDKFIYLDNFIDAIHKDFESYIEEIRDDEILRNNLLGIYKGDLEKYFK